MLGTRWGCKVNEYLTFPLILRARRIITRAAELLEEQAAALKDCSTVDGEWPAYESEAHEEYTGLISAAQDLRDLL